MAARPLTIARPSVSGHFPARTPRSPLDRYAGMYSRSQRRRGGGLMGAAVTPAAVSCVPREGELDGLGLRVEALGVRLLDPHPHLVRGRDKIEQPARPRRGHALA